MINDDFDKTLTFAMDNWPVAASVKQLRTSIIPSEFDGTMSFIPLSWYTSQEKCFWKCPETHTEKLAKIIMARNEKIEMPVDKSFVELWMEHFNNNEK